MNKSVVAIIAVIIVIGGAGAYLFTKKDSPKAATSQIDSAAAKAALATTGSNKIDIQNFAFGPSAITVKKGTTVTWTNQDTVKHDVVIDSGEGPKSNLLSKGESYSYTFNVLGTFKYHCTPHSSQMRATVVVTD